MSLDFFEQAYEAVKVRERALIEAVETCNRLSASHGVLQYKFETLLKWYDVQNGAPCEQIVHEQETARLQDYIIKLEDELATLRGYYEAACDRAELIRSAKFVGPIGPRREEHQLPTLVFGEAPKSLDGVYSGSQGTDPQGPSEVQETYDPRYRG